MCMRLHMRARLGASGCACGHGIACACVGAHECALGEKGCGVHVRTRVSTRVRACEGAHVRVCVCACVCGRVCLRRTHARV